MRNFPIQKAKFLSKFSEVLVSSNSKKHFLSFNLEKEKIQKISSALFTENYTKKSNKFEVSPNEDYIALFGNENGYISILDANTKQFLFELKSNFGCESVKFSPINKNILYSSSSIGGKVHEWDLKQRVPISVLNDHASNKTGLLALSQKNNLMALGSNSGIVNVYNNSSNNKLLKEIQNLTTDIDNLKFNRSGKY